MIAAPVAACTASKWLVVVLAGAGGGLNERPQGSITQNGRALGARKSICYRRLVVVTPSAGLFGQSSGGSVTPEICQMK
jgi:hypothetical protein